MIISGTMAFEWWQIGAAGGLPLLLGGIMLFAGGLWSRRRGDEPHCIKCDYILIGIQSDRCPECGTLLSPRTIVYGERYRRPWRIVGGILMIVLSPVPSAQSVTDWVN